MAVITLTGPTCSGKTSLESELQKLPGVCRATSHTTRLPRAGEVDGENYFFVSDEEYVRLENSGYFIETIEFGSAKYALSAKSLNDAAHENEHVIIVVEPNGAQQVHEFCETHGIMSFAVWVDCSLREQSRRWVARLTSDMLIGKEVLGAYAQRLELMMGEETKWRKNASSYSALSASNRAYEYQVILDSTSRTSSELAKIVMASFN